jgi:signal peptidase II
MKLLGSIMGGVLVLDQLTKLLIVKWMPLHSAYEVIPGFFELVHVRNTGGAFSIFANPDSTWRRFIFIGLTVAIVSVLLYAYGKLKEDQRWTKTSYALLCGGAIGNLIDRVRFGNVVDFLDFYVGGYHWPAFNVADSAITVGAVMLFISLMRNK